MARRRSPRPSRSPSRVRGGAPCEQGLSARATRTLVRLLSAGPNGLPVARLGPAERWAVIRDELARHGLAVYELHSADGTRRAAVGVGGQQLGLLIARAKR